MLQKFFKKGAPRGAAPAAAPPAAEPAHGSLGALLRHEIVLPGELQASLHEAAEEGRKFYATVNESRLELAFGAFDEGMRNALFEVLFLLNLNDPRLAEWKYTPTASRRGDVPMEATAELYMEGAPAGVRGIGQLSPTFREAFQDYVQETFGMGPAAETGAGVIVSISSGGSIGTIGHKSLASDLDLNVQYDLAPFLFDPSGWDDETFRKALNAETANQLNLLRRQKGLSQEALQDPSARSQLTAQARARLSRSYPRLMEFLVKNPGSYEAVLSSASGQKVRRELLSELMLLMKRAPTVAEGDGLKKREALLSERIKRIQDYVNAKFPTAELYLFPCSNNDYRLGRHASTLESKESPGSAYELLLNYETLMPGIQFTSNVPTHFLFSKAVNDETSSYRRYLDYMRFNLLAPLGEFREGIVDLGPTPDLDAAYVAQHRGGAYWEAFKASSGNLPKATLNLLRFEMLLEQHLLKTCIQLIKEPGCLDELVTAKAGDDSAQEAALAADTTGVPPYALLEMEAAFPLLRQDPWWLRYKALKIGYGEPRGVTGLDDEARDRISRVMDHAFALHVRISDVFTKPGDTRPFDSQREQVLLTFLQRAFPRETPRRTFLEHLFVGEVRSVNQFEQELREQFRGCLERVNAKIAAFKLAETEQPEEFRLWLSYYQRHFEPEPHAIQRGIMNHLKVARGRLQAGYDREHGWYFRSLQRESGVGKRFDTFGTLDHLPDEVMLHESPGFLSGMAHCILNGYYGTLNKGTLKEQRTVLEFDPAALDMGHEAHNTLAFVRPDQAIRIMERIDEVFPYRPYHYLDSIRLERQVTEVFVLLNLLMFGRISVLYRDNIQNWGCEEFDHPELLDAAKKLSASPGAMMGAAPIHRTLAGFFRDHGISPAKIGVAGWVNPNSVETGHSAANSAGKERELAAQWEAAILQLHGQGNGASQGSAEVRAAKKRASDWAARYRDVLNELGVPPAGASDKWHRKYPRFRPKLDSQGRLLKCGPHQGILINISAGGLCFASEVPFQPGAEVPITLANGFEVDARVVKFAQAKDAETQSSIRFRVGAKFRSEQQGYQCFVLVVKNFAEDIPL